MNIVELFEPTTYERGNFYTEEKLTRWGIFFKSKEAAIEYAHRKNRCTPGADLVYALESAPGEYLLLKQKTPVFIYGENEKNDLIMSAMKKLTLKELEAIRNY